MRIEIAPPRCTAEPEVEIAAIDRRIAWVLSHPGTSAWLRTALQAALAEEPVAVVNDVEMLRHLLLPRGTAHAVLAASSQNGRERP
ncbi:hypothetical protein CA234_11205 [Sphingomonas sp. ABOLE]|uniref:hypothetical protein n=1 Tax=Sphingomonas sp. ABOLE TaxID=1985878 RepID=UPI000F7E453B|nr:hypothetical protein [Sphingomonas sp. ABOLE]RSV40668.1 hypothetical protein CA234_11205 [Sphingomonas sp. ABOLE]